MSHPIAPHGSAQLRPLLVPAEERIAALAHAATLPRLTVSSREAGDIIMLGIGGFTPLSGFMGHADWHGVVTEMKLASGLFWPIPITLSTSAEQAEGLALGQELALADAAGNLLAILTLEEKYRIDKALEAREVFRTEDPAHPGVAALYAQGEVNLGGSLRVLSEGDFPERFPGVYLTPAQTRGLIAERGWKTVAAFQTRNPMHRSHEYLAKIALEVCDGVLIHSLLGNLKAGDIPSEVRVQAIDALTGKYFVEDSVISAGYPLDMRYAGPREALLHALFRQNYGCTHLIVGRDHAGVGDYYGPFDAQRVFDELPAGSLLTQPLKIDWTFWCEACASMASTKTCPHDASQRLLLSGSKLRKLLSEGGEVPAQFSRPEVLDILRAYYAGLEAHERVEVTLVGASAK
ncbi:MAG: sulfate adenylyltransferase [Gammaproteobacteria bacterium]|nr:sulfate adenylyltransferase [Gammaproteobacteria bacterium]